MRYMEILAMAQSYATIKREEADEKYFKEPTEENRLEFEKWNARESELNDLFRLEYDNRVN